MAPSERMGKGRIMAAARRLGEMVESVICCNPTNQTRTVDSDPSKSRARVAVPSVRTSSGLNSLGPIGLVHSCNNAHAPLFSRSPLESAGFRPGRLKRQNQRPRQEQTQTVTDEAQAEADDGPTGLGCPVRGRTGVGIRREIEETSL
ncbi:unnamed protein product [Protopolystoma xenopodis]|uniref:Uncharacterized protein n=1 Tax=Protopolystoma xenopodis TaxID=117903 RepID=A0A448XCU6_9PLAT|nr:unnamed protein product [Protopolystoma xenopodis]